ncbi:hypothetical protein [Shinella sp.]|uniref:hypothetical protein n=1 Tax=Shinella sp. TaxID=1870904 RepID=UPI0028A2C9A3|nr:hypothetical protein [Shinella sp.]
MAEHELEKSEKSFITLNFSDVLGLGKAAEKLTPTANKIVTGLAKCLSPALDAAKIYLESRAMGQLIVTRP